MPKQIILCDCLGSQSLDPERLSKATDVGCSRVHTALCTEQLEQAAKAISNGDVVIACQQERRLFEELAAETGADQPEFVDLRDRAGWSDDPRPKDAKMAALIAEARLDFPPARTIDVVSDGLCLIIGPSETAFATAEQLCSMLSVTVLVTDDCEIPADRRFDIVRGTLKSAKGTLGNFEIEIDALQELIPGGRGTPSMTEPRDGARSSCDIILDLRGDTPLFSADDKRDGYLRADPGSSEQRHKAVLEASQLVGTFEKLLHVRLDASLCAHSRARKTGCTKCLDICPTGAITPDGDHVAVDTLVCAGCGACSAVCPSGAIGYDAPPVSSVFARISALSVTYRKLSDIPPRLLVHDGDFGAELIRLSARYGKGLPADVIPLEVASVASFGHAEMLAALACGFASVSVIVSPTLERDALDIETVLAGAIAGDERIILLEPAEPDALDEALYGEEPAPIDVSPILPLGSRRQIARLSAMALHPDRATIPLPAGAPYGTVIVDKEACTLCLSCVSLCPSGALGDNPDLPQLRFQEEACLQCGLCRNICPESAITLEPRLDLGDEALSQRVLHEEEPFACIECGALFGVKATIMRITEQLAGKHSMFASEDRIRMIQMCDDCRVKAQYHQTDNPFAAGERPKVRTTDDYLSKRRDH